MNSDNKVDKPSHPNEKIVIHIDREEYFVDKIILTGAELKALANIANAFDLFKIVPGQGDDIKIDDTEQVTLENGDHFYSVPKTLNPGTGNAAAGD